MGSSSGRVLAGLSGGVDSAVAVLLLKDQGYDVTAVTMAPRPPDALDAPPRGCRDFGGSADRDRIGRLADRLGVPLRIVDCWREYEAEVLAPFRREYRAGRTPNPCVMCNPALKFGLLPQLATHPGETFDYFATGHYARVEWENGHPFLARATAAGEKDQSYFLYRLTEEQLSRTLFPLGALDKDAVRARARRENLPVADQADSQDFYAGDHADLLGLPPSPGEVVDTDGRVLGRHEGYWRFTPGQRKGLRLPARGPDSEPLYVLSIDAANNRVVAGPRGATWRTSCRVGRLCLSASPPEAGEALEGKMRSGQALRLMKVTVVDEAAGCWTVAFAPVSGVAPGQSLVLYRGGRVAGGGVILE